MRIRTGSQRARRGRVFVRACMCVRVYTHQHVNVCVRTGPQRERRDLVLLHVNVWPVCAGAHAHGRADKQPDV